MLKFWDWSVVHFEYQANEVRSSRRLNDLCLLTFVGGGN